jgi:hypothetical protein
MSTIQFTIENWLMILALGGGFFFFVFIPFYWLVDGVHPIVISTRPKSLDANGNALIATQLDTMGVDTK